jgi:hypothetical protein
MVGYARGSFTDPDALIAQQVLEGMRSRHDITRTVWPDGRKVIASVNGGDHGEERAAMLLDAEGRLLALGLVNGHCRVPPHRDHPKVCNPAPADRAVDLPARRREAGRCRAAGRVGEDAARRSWQPWPRATIPGRRPTRRRSRASNTSRASRMPGWRDEQLPPGFPASLRPLLVQTAEVNSTASAGKIVLPKGLAGQPMRTDYERSQRNEPRLPDAEVTLRSYAALDTLVDTYRELAKGATRGRERPRDRVQRHRWRRAATAFACAMRRKPACSSRCRAGSASSLGRVRRHDAQPRPSRLVVRRLLQKERAHRQQRVHAQDARGQVVESVGRVERSVGQVDADAGACDEVAVDAVARGPRRG